MSTVNISLPNDHITFVNHLVREHGFANRSELFRSLLRLVKKQPEILSTASTYPFVSPTTRSRSKIISQLKKTGKYSEKFLDEVATGLKDSSYFDK